MDSTTQKAKALRSTALRRGLPDSLSPQAAIALLAESALSCLDAHNERNVLGSLEQRIANVLLAFANRYGRPREDGSVLIEYRSAWSTSPSVRQVNPVALDITGNAPALSGYCHQHGGARAFKLGQISGIRVLEDEPF